MFVATVVMNFQTGPSPKGWPGLSLTEYAKTCNDEMENVKKDCERQFLLAFSIYISNLHFSLPSDARLGLARLMVKIILRTLSAAPRSWWAFRMILARSMEASRE